ncbi:TATA-box-binding protein [Pyrococcus kukulkanii]|uniref:TATA-box-binding protein n=1 Tax=Pyrococcus kukulkanii TaxID=1609559 RepID=A0A127B9L9_9EURY|nr:TATA-box-binding protein [Pyrococcus kukulkanii]AMM53994.1 TATA-box-binding protein [Pyrococcus kukulkanii]RLF91568.1 MAG: TATA-box-binding protein [Thermococci archaeon]
MVDMSKVKLRIENIVASVDLFAQLDLEKVLDICPNSKYNPEEFPGIICRFDDPKVALLIFSSGKLVVTGAKSVQDIERAVAKLVQKLKGIGVKFKRAPQIDIQNMVFSGDIGREFNLDNVALTLPNCEYEPEQFPGVIYRVKEPRAVILLFSSGKIVCSGAKSEADAWEAVRKLLRELEKYGLMEEEEEEL